MRYSMEMKTRRMRDAEKSVADMSRTFCLYLCACMNEKVGERILNVFIIWVKIELELFHFQRLTMTRVMKSHSHEARAIYERPIIQ